ncbi:hypothetical protein FRB91_009121 [Serendipita sp. 411]|nr:hypothetical protein FRC15_004905 [Serendipita sp. 397]KAG8858877.1 hypothetical protein FRB91_009121 [Serendipita sp. 411]
MAPIAGGAGTYAAEKRKQLGGKSGIPGLIQNKRVFGLTVFASMGGLLYGMYHDLQCYCYQPMFQVTTRAYSHLS